MSNILYNVRCDVYRETITDDVYGGAETVTGTFIVRNQPARLDYYTPKIYLTGIQGIETDKIYSIFFRSTYQKPIPIRENDIVTVVFPTIHDDYNVRLRVRGVQRNSLHPQDPNSIVECTLNRIETSRGNNF